MIFVRHSTKAVDSGSERERNGPNDFVNTKFFFFGRARNKLKDPRTTCNASACMHIEEGAPMVQEYYYRTREKND